MRIISKKQDYYDSALAFGHDTNVIFHRTEEVIVSKPQEQLGELSMFASGQWVTRLPTSSAGRSSVSDVTICMFKILFCGKFYHGVEISTYAWYNFSSNQERFCVYTFEDLETTLIERVGVKLADVASTRRQTQLKQHFSEVKTDFDLAFSLKSPVVIGITLRHDHVNVIKNGILKDYQFYKVVDPYTAFQEIDMFMSGIMAPENRPMVTIADKYKIQEHGFDKSSFRKAPTKKR